jgi:hypothetical protein
MAIAQPMQQRAVLPVAEPPEFGATAMPKPQPIAQPMPMPKPNPTMQPLAPQMAPVSDYTPQAFKPPQITAPSAPAYRPQAPMGAPSGGGGAAQAAGIGDMGNLDTSALRNFQGFNDAVMNEHRRSLDPMMADRENAFRQRMVGQGI